jgi:RHS repeat-associated protein
LNYPFLGAKERDNETGLDYFIARYYASTQGRFISPDQPLVDQNESNPQSWNLYIYVRNNPLRGIDPQGDSCYYGENGRLIGCDGDKRIRIEGERLYFTPKKGSAPLVYNLNKLKVQEEIGDKTCSCKPIPTEGQFVRSVFGVWGAGAAIGSGIGGLAAGSTSAGAWLSARLFGPVITTLNIGIRVGSAWGVARLTGTDRMLFENASKLAGNAGTYKAAFDALSQALWNFNQFLRINNVGTPESPIWGSLSSRTGLIEINGVTMIVRTNASGQIVEVVGRFYR